ncbi:ATP-binding cassette sub-family C member 5-like [Ptychodera flava]|uniref:ATP-binding cassette sub-family C member 5-like n=1 Tax=Ptychodera flava TaxID=63121 RepID=UPI003969BCAC
MYFTDYHLFTNDGDRLVDACNNVQHAFTGPFILLLTVMYTTYILGPSALCGSSLFFLTWALQAMFSRLLGSIRWKSVRITDTRILMVNEMTTSIKLIKMYAWEKPFAKKIAGIRQKEKKILQHAGFVESISSSLNAVIQGTAIVVYGKPFAFAVVAMFALTRSALTSAPRAMKVLSEAYVAAKRMQIFLQTIEPISQKFRPIDDRVAIDIAEATFAWDNNEQNWDERVKLDDDGKRLSTKADIDGADNCNSTTSVKGLFNINLTLNKMPLTSGEVKIDGTMAYVSQQAWIFNDTLRENILFGKSYEKKRYEAVVYASALQEDIKMLQSGDLTEIGERGINLSGGQKQRVSLARALYADRDIYLLDDPLSAVDAKVGQHIFNHYIKDALKGKSIIFVTHQLQYLGGCDSIYVMRDGQVLESGTHHQLNAANGQYFALLKTFHSDKDKDGFADGIFHKDIDKDINLGNITSQADVHKERLCHTDGTNTTFDGTETADGTTFERDDRDMMFYVYVFLGILAALIPFTVLRCVAYVKPDVLCTFSVDVSLPRAIEDMLVYMTTAFFSCVSILIVFPWILIALIPFAVIIMFTFKYYHHGMRDCRRLDSITRSPWFSHVTSTMQGLPTIHAYQREEDFKIKFAKLLDENTVAFSSFSFCGRWAGVRPDSIAIMTAFLTGLMAVLSRGMVSPTLVGVALSYSVQFTGQFQFGIRLAGDAESSMTSVERIYHYLKTLTTEEPLETHNNRPPDNWPSHGRIHVENLAIRYRDNLPLALKGVTFNVGSMEKVGIVGRTGAGKSSLGVSLFRLVEPTSGTIHIDGINISDIRLQDLRSRLSVIPQDPVLFVGTIRYNLDPIDQYSDEETWKSLEKTHLKDTVRKGPGKLKAPVIENGENFSVGQRQLICMARALLKSCKVLILDEATAAIDTETDSLIQQTLRDAFRNCTMLIIAHRLHTVQNFDKILVMDTGKVVEYDSPSALLANPESWFSAMMNATEKARDYLA